jgi:RecA-family ATPase
MADEISNPSLVPDSFREAAEDEMALEFTCETVCMADIRDRELPPPDQVLVDFADRGDKLFIIGTSKSRKSFTALQTALHIVSGGMARMPFEVGGKGLSVLVFNPEIKGHHYDKRAQRMARTLDISPDNLRNLHVAHRRGKKTTARHIIETAKAVNAQVIIIDPAYKLAGWDEKDVSEWLENFDRIVEETGCLLVVVHHEKKGVAGDRQGVDRGSGDGKMSRDYDCALLLAPQRDEPDDCVVFSQIQRNYAPADPVVMRFDHGAFEETDLPPIEATSQTLRAKAGKKEPSQESIVRLIRDHGPYSKTELKEILIREGCTTRSAPAYIDMLARLDASIEIYKERKPGGRTLVCTTEQRIRMESEKV